MLCSRCHKTWPDDRQRCPNDGWKLVADRRGQRVAGRFEVEQLLGVGGAGSSVWAAYEPARRRKVALKLLNTSEGSDHARFERGAILATSLIHPNIARAYEHGQEGDLHWISMELLSGETLASHIAVMKTMPPVDAVLLADQVLAALEHAHAGEIVHRDLKPANIFITKPDGGGPPRALILDFGIARLTGPSAAERFGPFFPDDDPIAPELESEVTGEHRICGTPEFMAPEQILGAAPDTRSDLYALGVILYRLVGGQLPFRARTRYEIYHRHLHEVPPPLPAHVSVPNALAAVIHRALSKRPDERFVSAADMRETLRQAVGLAPVERPRLFPTDSESHAFEPEPMGFLPAEVVSAPSPLPVAAPPPAPPRPRQRSVSYGVIGVVAALLMAIGLLLGLTIFGSDPPANAAAQAEQGALAPKIATPGL